MKRGKEMFGKKSEVIGIDIQKNVIRYCMYKKGYWLYGEKLGKGSFFKENGLKNKEELSDLLDEIFSEVKVKNPQLVIATLNSKLLIRQIPLQDMTSEEEIREFLFFELGQSISLPFEDPIFDLLVLERPKVAKSKRVKKRKLGLSKADGLKDDVKIKTMKRNRFAVNGKVPIIITSEPLLIELGDTFQKVGGNLVGVDFSALAYTQIFKKRINWGQTFVLVEIDSGEATITIFEKMAPVYVQNEAYNRGNWRYREEKGQVIPEYRSEGIALKKLGETLKNLIAYFENDISVGSTVERIYLVGGHPRLKTDVLEIMEMTNVIPTSVLEEPSVAEDLNIVPYRFLLAASLALKEVH